MKAFAQYTISALLDGEKGRGIDHVITQYLLGYSETDEPEESVSDNRIWSAERPIVLNGTCLWQRDMVFYDDGTSEPSQAFCVSGIISEVIGPTLKDIRELIEKVNGEYEGLYAELTGSYLAKSDFGEYLERTNAYLEANPEAITQYYSFYSDLKANVEAVGAAFEEYKVGTGGYIRTGIVYYDGAVPVYGVAVGQNLTAKEIDGEQVIDQKNFRATFTAKKLSFWQDDKEIAYVSNNQLYITGITVLDKMTLGKWEISTSRGMAFKWIGG